MALILNIETATKICSVAIGHDGEVLTEAEANTLQSHAAQLTCLIETCLKTAQLRLKELDAIAVSNGPGSYTGLRIGFSVAKGICYALDKPLITVDTLSALAWLTRKRVKKTGYYCPMIDARRMEVYTAIFEPELQMQQKPHAHILTSASFSGILKSQYPVICSGDGAAKFQRLLNHPRLIFSNTQCSAIGMVKLSQMAFNRANFANVAYSEPFYLKSPNITIAKKKI